MGVGDLLRKREIVRNYMRGKATVRSLRRELHLARAAIADEGMRVGPGRFSVVGPPLAAAR